MAAPQSHFLPDPDSVYDKSVPAVSEVDIIDALNALSKEVITLGKLVRNKLVAAESKKKIETKKKTVTIKPKVVKDLKLKKKDVKK